MGSCCCCGKDPPPDATHPPEPPPNKVHRHFPPPVAQGRGRGVPVPREAQPGRGRGSGLHNPAPPPEGSQTSTLTSSPSPNTVFVKRTPSNGSISTFSSTQKLRIAYPAPPLPQPAEVEDTDVASVPVQQMGSFDSSGTTEWKTTSVLAPPLPVKPNNLSTSVDGSPKDSTRNSSPLEPETPLTPIAVPPSVCCALSARRSRLAPPISTQGWRRGRLLGQGSFGRVYECIDPSGTLIAVKEIELSRNANPEAVRSLQRELDTLRGLRHPNLVSYLGCSQSSGALHIFMEHAPGGSIASLTRRRGKLSLPQIQRYTRQILLGLEYLHGNGIVHRDIKGDNVLLGEKGEVKLTDYGCSAQLENVTGKDHSNSKGSLVGTPAWMAPELIKDPQYHAPIKADVWSVGCTILEMLGRRPWNDTSFTSPFALLYHIGTSDCLPTGMPQDCHPLLYNFLLRCFKRDPLQRPSIMELKKDPFLEVHFPDGSMYSSQLSPCYKLALVPPRQWPQQHQQQQQQHQQSRNTTEYADSDGPSYALRRDSVDTFLADMLAQSPGGSASATHTNPFPSSPQQWGGLSPGGEKRASLGSTIDPAAHITFLAPNTPPNKTHGPWTDLPRQIMSSSTPACNTEWEWRGEEKSLGTTLVTTV
eukprot:Sspe_Gene.76789::Locus_47969_Transcript_1_1_Confidence_1.000_Length_2156::g.76789::m.76789